ncbi:MAG TPA: hypothetical protein VI728_09105 [Syntrophales bacterium]|nr:hypothetical protein [Syntrophales bacterium]
MMDAIRPVRPGILIGLIGILLGISWAFWLVLGHEQIHSSLAASRAVLEQPGQEANHHAENQIKSVKHVHSDGKEHMHVKKEAAAQEKTTQHAHGTGHDDALMDLAHTRLMRGHLHAMGLGLGAIIISVVLSFTSAQAWIKTAASVFAGIGGLVYPLAWIVMGYRTPSLGPELAETSVTLIAGPGVVLVLSGVLAAAFFIFKDILMRK